MRVFEWLVLLPLWRRIISDPKWHVPAAIGTGIAWVVIVIIIAIASAGGDDEEGGEAVAGEPTVTETTEPETTEESAATTPEPSEPTATPEPTPEPPTGPTTTFNSGTFIVGEDIEAGTYTNVGSSGFCYWERVSGFGGTFDEIIANGAVETRQIVTIAPTDAGFTSNDCGTWTQDLSAVTSSPTDPFGEGMYQVGVDIVAGTWRNDGGGDLCYWARLGGFSGGFDEIIANDVGAGQHIVTIAGGDAGFESNDCGAWTKID